MSTTSQSYAEKLYEIQTNHPVLEHAPFIGSSEEILDIDLDARKITAPKFLSVAKDHQAETVYFRVDRFYENQDLATKHCVIQYRNANGDDYLYPVPSYDMRSYAAWNPTTGSNEASKILIPWCIQGPATAKSGTIKFSVKFFKVNADKEIIYELNTQPATSVILEGQSNDSLNSFEQNQFDLSNEYLANLLRVEEIQDSLNLYWVDV